MANQANQEGHEGEISSNSIKRQKVRPEDNKVEILKIAPEMQFLVELRNCDINYLVLFWLKVLTYC